MKIPRLVIRKKLRASTARRSSLGAPDEMDYEEMSEPNMKLSRALLIVLVLHVVAVAGIVAFNTIKSRQGAFPPPAKASASATPGTAIAPATLPRRESPLAAAGAQATPSSEPTAKIPRAMPVDNESGNFYVVAKGDNPVKIAKKLKVSEFDLLTVNHIDDPRKLQIGQKLIVPQKKTAAKGKKSEE